MPIAVATALCVVAVANCSLVPPPSCIVGLRTKFEKKGTIS